MAEAIIFDVDGTLLDSVDLHAKAWQEAFQHLGHRFSFAEIRSQIGKGGDQILPMFLSKEELEREREGEEIKKFRSDLFKSKYLDQVKAFPYVRELFKRIRDSGQRATLASSAKPDELQVFEKIANIPDLVEEGTSSADAKRSKPHPDIFEAALGKLGIETKKSDVIVVGDSPYDAEAAKKAGLHVVGVRCGGFPEEDLRAAGCEAIFDNPEDIWKHYDQTPLAPATRLRSSS